jgi:hypothetical protein
MVELYPHTILLFLLLDFLSRERILRADYIRVLEIKSISHFLKGKWGMEMRSTPSRIAKIQGQDDSSIFVSRSEQAVCPSSKCFEKVLDSVGSLW